MKRCWMENRMTCVWLPEIGESYKNRQIALSKMIDETIISVREEPLVSKHIPLLISLGIDPQTYVTHDFHNGQGIALQEKWWFTWVYHIVDGKLVELFDRSKFPKYCNRMEAATPCPWISNDMK